MAVARWATEAMAVAPWATEATAVAPWVTVAPWVAPWVTVARWAAQWPINRDFCACRVKERMRCQQCAPPPSLPRLLVERLNMAI